MRGFFYCAYFVWLTLPLSASHDAFMQLSKNGTVVATDSTHSWVKLYGFNQAVENAVNVGGGSGGIGSGRAQAKAVSMQMASDGSIAEMTQGLAEGRTYNITLHLARKQASSYTSVMTELVFEQVKFSKVSANGKSGDDRLLFDVEFHYQKLKVTHTVLNNQGGVTTVPAGGWDFTNNQPISVAPTIPPLGDYDGSSTPAGIDSDGDGMSNSWEEIHNLNPNNSADAGLDPDRDDFTNLQEFIAGTNPNKGNSFFQVSTTLSATSPVPRVMLTWSGIAGRTYEIEASSNLTNGFSVIHTMTPNVNGTLTHQPAAGTGPYYRVKVKK